MQQKGSLGISKEKNIFRLLYKKNNKFTLVAYSNEYFARDIDNRTSTSRYLMNMGSTTISWSCRK